MNVSEELSRYRDLCSCLTLMYNNMLKGDARIENAVAHAGLHSYIQLVECHIAELAKDELVAVTLTRHDWGIVLYRKGIRISIQEERIADTIEEQLAS